MTSVLVHFGDTVALSRAGGQFADGADVLRRTSIPAQMPILPTSAGVPLQGVNR